MLVLTSQFTLDELRGVVLIKHFTAQTFYGKGRGSLFSRPPIVDFIAKVAARVTKMPVNSREFVALSQHPSAVVPHQSRCSPVNGKCSTVGKPHAIFSPTLRC